MLDQIEATRIGENEKHRLYMQGYLEIPGKREAICAYQKAYRQRKYAKDSSSRLHAEYRQRPEARAKNNAYMKEYYKRPLVIERRKKYLAEYNSRPEVRERTTLNRKIRYLHVKYGVTIDEINLALSQQGNVCAICKTSDWDKIGPVVDHDHKTGLFRGVLCNKCNTAIGMLKERPDVARSAADYLERGHP